MPRKYSAALDLKGLPIACLLWPDSDETHARNNLRQALWRLRQVIGEEYILGDRTSVGWNPDAEYQSDIATLEEAEGEDLSADALIHSVSVYDDLLLPGFYDDWVVLEQERWQAIFEERMQALIDRLCEEARWREVLRRAERWIAHGQVPEPAYRALMQAHAALGDRASAVAAFQRCTEVLAEELGVGPAEETVALYQRIRDGDLAPATISRSQPLDLKPRRPAFLDPDAEAAAVFREPFAGRDAQLGRLAGFLESALAGRGQAAYVSGEAGWGKTRLLGEFSRRAQEAHPDLIVVSGICTAFTESRDPYLPFREIVRMFCGDVEQGWAAGRITREHALRLWRFLPQVVKALLAQGRHLIDTFVPGEAHLQLSFQSQPVPEVPVRHPGPRGAGLSSRGDRECSGEPVPGTHRGDRRMPCQTLSGGRASSEGGGLLGAGRRCSLSCLRQP